MGSGAKQKGVRKNKSEGLFIAFFTSHRSPLSECLEQAMGGTPENFWWNSSQAKRAALPDYKREPSDRRARNNAQRIARRLANDYWLNLCQLSADCGHIRAMYDGLKIVLFTGTATPQKEDYYISFRPKRHPNCTFKVSCWRHHQRPE